MSSSEVTFAEWLHARNQVGLRIGAWLVMVLLPLTWAFDWSVLPEQAAITGTIRFAVAAFAAFILLSMRRLPKLAERNAETLSQLLTSAVAACAAVVTFLHDGYSSPLFVVFLIVFLGASQLFIWSFPRAFAVYAILAAIFIAPWLTGWVPPKDPEAALISVILTLFAIVLCLTGNRVRLNQEKQAFVTAQNNAFDREDLNKSLTQSRDLDRLKSGFFTSIVETIRGPLTLMISPLDSMLSGDVGDFRANQIEYIQTVRRSALRVLKLTDDLVDLSHLEGGLLRLQLESTDLVGVLQSVVDHAAASASEKDIAITLDSDFDRLDIALDMEKLERAITHIVAAAIRCTSTAGRIDLRLSSEDDHAQLTVRDNGGGLPPDWLASFMADRTDGSWLPPRSPDGLGLVLAREIIVLHNGSIDVRSRSETGTTFSIRLPTNTAPNTGVASSAPSRADRLRARPDYRFREIDDLTKTKKVEHAPGEGKATSVLIVDDNLEILRFTQSLLSADHAVFVASDGQEGLEIALAQLPDVVITDAHMPRLDGLGLVRALRSDPRTAQIPTVMLTARNQAEDRESARESGVDLVLEKPFNPRELRTAIHELFAKKHRQASTFMHEQARSFEIISAGLAHEMHNPLAYIKNAYFVIGESCEKIANSLDNEDLDATERRARIAKAQTKIDKMIPLANRGIQKVEQLVDLMRRYAREGYSSESIDLAIDEAIATVLDMIAPKGDADVTLSPDLKAADAVVKGVAEELQQAITNLTQNAIDAVGSGGHVWVRSRVEDRQVRIEIADDGPGIPKEQLARIFTPFFTTKEVGKGMGLGLTITRQVIKQHHGTLEVDSTPGRGTTFTIRLPLSHAIGTEEQPQSALEQAAIAPSETASQT
jgi:signal transduction histidine kinase